MAFTVTAQRERDEQRRREMAAAAAARAAARPDVPEDRNGPQTTRSR